MKAIQVEVLGLLQDYKYCVYSDAEENRNVKKQYHGVDPCEVQSWR
jgi:hypothetical protein